MFLKIIIIVIITLRMTFSVPYISVIISSS